MIHITILLALLIILAALHLLAKYKDVITSFIKWSAYGVILVAVLVIICKLAQGIGSMCYHHGKCGTEQCGPGKPGGMGACMHDNGCKTGGMRCHGMGQGMCQGACRGMSGCCMMGQSEMDCCAKHSGHMGCEGDENEDEGEMGMGCHHGDSTMKKEIHKEIKIEKK
jgi:hypothetical protein